MPFSHLLLNPASVLELAQQHKELYYSAIIITVLIDALPHRTHWHLFLKEQLGEVLHFLVR
jgi:hypothetical protein